MKACRGEGLSMWGRRIVSQVLLRNKAYSQVTSHVPIRCSGQRRLHYSSGWQWCSSRQSRDSGEAGNTCGSEHAESSMLGVNRLCENHA
eukprot:848583-Amphidinium_carterae.1